MQRKLRLKFAAFDIIIWFLIIIADSSLGEYFEECDGVNAESFVASLTNCNAYIYCDGENSLIGYCAGDQYFNPDSVNCDDKENVNCPLDQTETDTDIIETTTSIIATTTTTTTPTTTTIETTTSATSTASATEIATTTIIITSENTGNVPTTATTSQFEAITIPPIIRDNCPIIDDPNQIVLMPNSQSCSEYYVCYHGQAIEMHCANNLHFNTYQGKCDFPENAQCLNDRPNANKCLPHVTDFFPHPENCNYFYYCIKGFITIQQCPFYYGWDVDRRSCVQMPQAKCFNKQANLRT